MKVRRNLIAVFVNVCVGCLLILAGAAFAEDAGKSKIDRGKYLVDFGGCHDCHSPTIRLRK